MKRIILIFSFILMLSLVGAVITPQIYYKINLNYFKGDIDVNKIHIEFSQKEIKEYGFYHVEVLDYNREVLDTTFFEVPNEVLWDEVDEETGEIVGGGLLVLDNVTFDIYVPYYENALEIVIYDENLTELDRVRVNQYSVEEEVRKDLREDEGKTIEEDRKEKRFVPEEKIFDKVKEYWWVLIIVFVILLGVLINSLKKKK